MADIIDISTKNVSISDNTNITTPTIDPIVSNILQLIIQEANLIKDITVFIKYKDDSYTMYNTGSLAEKALTIQLLQHDINNDLSGFQAIELDDNNL